MPDSSPIEPDDPQAAAGLQADDIAGRATQAALLALIDAEERRLRHMTYSITRCLEATASIMSDVRIKALQRRKRCFRDQDHMLAHVLTTVKNLAIDWRRRESRSRVSYCPDPYAHPDILWDDLLNSTDDASAPQDDVEELMKVLAPHFEKLGKRCEAVLKLRMCDVPFEKIAVSLGMRISTAKKHYSNAIKVLKRLNLSGDSND